MEKFARNWTCPHCGRPQTATEEDFASGSIHFYMTKSILGHIGIHSTAVCCANPECRMPMVHLEIGKTVSKPRSAAREFADDPALFSRRLIPENSAKPQPDYIPEALREDYLEACMIRELSPKASATLSRRCIQGMIHDYCSISKGRLIDEINELKKRVDDGNAPKGVSEESVDAIDHVRGIGNIGAHMGKDINLIVPVDPEEAQILIDLIESLFEEWYVARNRRQARLAKIASLAAEKKSLIAEQKKPRQEPPKESD